MQGKILVLTGSGRSGTTLMAKALNDVYSYGIAAEPKVVRNVIEYAVKNDLRNEDKFNALIDYCYNSPAFHRLRTIQKIETNIDALRAEIEERNANGVVLGMFRYLAKVRQRKLVGYKDPKDVTNMAFIKRHVPGSYFIHITRNGEDVAYSVNKFDWGPNNPVSGAIFWKRQLRKFYKDVGTIPRPDYLEIKLEGLNEDIPGVAQKIDRFIFDHTGASDAPALATYLSNEFRMSDNYKKSGLVYRMVRYIVSDLNQSLGYEEQQPKKINLLYQLLIPCFFIYDIPFILYGRIRRKSNAI